MLDGSGDGDLWAKRAVEIGMPALSLTDHGTIAGTLEHIAACHKAGIVPIVGVEAYFKDNRLVREGPRFHLTLLAANYDGWISLQRLTSEAYASGYMMNEGTIGYKAHVDWDLLARHSKGVYCISGCYGGMFSNLVQRGYEPDVMAFVMKMKSIFGERFSLEIQHHDFDGQRDLNIATLRVANETGTPMTACGDPHYPFREWGNMNDVMFMLATKTSNEKRRKKEVAGDDIYDMKQDNPTLYLMSADEKRGAYQAYHPQLPPHVVEAALAHSGEILSGFMPIMLDNDIKMPPLTRRILGRIDTEDEMRVAFEEAEKSEDWLNSVDDELVKTTFKRWVYEGLKELIELYEPEHWQRHPYQTYLDRIEHEFTTFDAIGIHVWRYVTMAAGEIRWARRNKISVGPGRGSVAGSLACYCSGITDIDPISYGLMFERFINVNRKGMPDVDIDFMPGPKGRDRVKRHTAWVYGEPNVVDIAAYGTYGPRKAIQDVCRVFDDEIDFISADRIRRAIELKPTDKMDLEECAEKFPELAEFKRIYPFLWDMARRIEGAPYSVSKHASGVLVKPSHVEIATAYKVEKTGEPSKITAWPDTRELLAAYGWLKLDYLVIDGLVRQFEIMRALEEREGTPIDLRRLPVRWNPLAVETEVMRQFHRAATLGVWQLEGKGTIPVLKSIRPDNMHDLAAINALIRPGPRGAGMTEKYAKIKHGLDPLSYWHDAVEPALRNTYGLMIYQEQAMEIAVQLGGFTRTEADDLRKAMGKKYREGIEAVKRFLRELQFEEKFIHNAAKMVGEEWAIKIWDYILAFGGYSFNASHAYAYALISYHDMLLKTMAPADFYAWLLTFTDSKSMGEKLSATMREGSRFRIRIKNPDINNSDIGFKVVDRQTILYGIGSVKHVGPAGVGAIFDNRPFSSYEEFEAKVPPRLCNKNAKQSLVGVGAFDAMGARYYMTDAEKASAEEAYLGIRLSGMTEMEKYTELLEATINSEDEFDQALHGSFIVVGGEITNVKHTRIRNGRRAGSPMGFVNLAFGTDTYRVTVFTDMWERHVSQFRTGKIVVFNGIKEVSEKYGAGLVAKQFITIEEFAMQQTGQQPVPVAA